MNGEATWTSMTQIERDQFRLSQRNQEAVMTLWTGFGAILSLLLTCFIGSLWRTSERTAASVAIMIFLLVVTIILFFTVTKRDQRWYVVCSLINHAGIGLAVLIVLDVLEIDIRLKQLALSGLPSAAILFGIVMYYVGMEENGRNNLLYGGAVFFALLLGVSVYLFFENYTEFWLCTAVCALLSCANLGALIWNNNDPDSRSIYKSLAVGSFAIYILLAVIAIVVFLLGALGKLGDVSKRKKRGKSSGKSNSVKKTESRRLDPGVSVSSGSVKASGIGTGIHAPRRIYIPRHLWYTNMYYGSSDYCSSEAAMAGLNENERLAMENKLRRRRRIILFIVTAIVIAVIVAAVLLGRG